MATLTGAMRKINLSTWLAANPASIVADNLGLSKVVMDYLPKKLVGSTSPAGPRLAANRVIGNLDIQPLREPVPALGR